ncbi:ABC transporter substrate-binding protein [Sporosarcina sp. CAU 1771]
MKKKSRLFQAVLIVAAALLVGCSQTAKGDSDTGQALEEISIMLDWYPNAVHSSLYYAKEEGLFEEEGLNVTIEMPAETSDPLKLAATGKVDLAISYQMLVALARSEDIPVVSLATFVRHSLDGVMFKEESGIRSPKDLENKKVGYASSAISEAVIETMVEADGGDPSKVQMVDVGWDLMPAISTGNVDAVTSAYVNHELVILREEGHNVDWINLSDYGVPANYELILVTGEKALTKKKAAFEKFWRALTKAQDIVQENPEIGLQVLLDHENDSFPLDENIETQSLNVLLPLMDAGALPFGYQEEESWAEVINWLVEKELIKEPYDANEVFENIMQK